MNILVSKNYTVQDHSHWHNDRSTETDLSQNYAAMQTLMLNSAKKYLQNCDHSHVYTGTAPNIRQVFVENFKEIYQLWQQGHNILYVDLDVVFTNTYDVFGSTDLFTMFNYTQPQHTYCSHYDINLPHFFNCGIRYYPRDMAHSVWELGFKMLDKFDWKRWDSEQVIYNVMQWSQTPDVNAFLQPRLAYQYISDDVNINNAFNKIDLRDAAAVHVHGSRGSANRLNVMTRLEGYHEL